jgi:hypothetical protein
LRKNLIGKFNFQQRASSLHNHFFDAAVWYKPDEGDKHINGGGNSRVEKRE